MPPVPWTLEYVEDDDESDDNYDYFDEEEVEEIQQTAAALADEGYTPEEIEITILARKKQPKPPRQKRRFEEEEEDAAAAKKKKRRRRRKKTNIPKQAAFSSPVISKEATTPSAPTRSGGGRRAGRNSKRGAVKPATSGPLVEYVRGPMRLNMAPVASAGPSDVAKRSKKKPGRRRKPTLKAVDINAGSVISAVSETSPVAIATHSAGTHSEEGGPKKRKRRRRRKKKPGDAVGEASTASDAPIDFFSSNTSNLAPTGITQGGGGGNGSQKKKRRRRRKRGSGKNRAAGDGQTTDAQGTAEVASE